jgi:lipopolysaccharide export system permease protein
MDLYILKELVPSFLVAELFFTFVYLIKGIQEAVEQIVNKGLPASEVLSVIGYMIGKALPFTTPMAILMSSIICAGRFSLESEFVAMRAAGISYQKIYRPFIVFSIVIAVFTFYFSNYFSPYSFKKFDEFQEFVKNYNPIAVISPGEFVDDNRDKWQWTIKAIYVDSKDPVTGNLEDIQIRIVQRHKNLKYMKKLIAAQEGKEVLKLGRDNALHKAIRLYKGYVVTYDKKTKMNEITDFRNGHMDLYIDPYSDSKKQFVPNLPSHFDFLGLIDKRGKKEKKIAERFERKLTIAREKYRRIKKRIKAYKSDRDIINSLPPGPEKKKKKAIFDKKYKDFTVKIGKKRLRYVRGNFISDSLIRYIAYCLE